MPAGKTRSTFYVDPELNMAMEVVMLTMRVRHKVRAGKSAIARAALRSFIAEFEANPTTAIAQVEAEQAKGE